jgi:hypothetical protein
MPKIIEACVLFILMVAAFCLIPSVYADLGPPVEYVRTETGNLFCIASNVSMPEVIVNATIHLRGSWNYDINVSCVFTIRSQIEQNLTTSFVYPSIWTYFTPEQNVSMHEFDIRVNDTAVEYAILHFEEFKSKYDVNQTEWYYVNDCNFAEFNFSIGSEDPIIVDVFTSFSSTSVGHEFMFDYIVDTARQWENNTHETVRFQFDRDNDTEIIDYRYEPLCNVGFNGNNYSAAMIWDFSIHDFEYDRVRFVVQQREYPIHNHVFPPDPRYLILAIGTAVALGAIGSFLAMKRLHHH